MSYRIQFTVIVILITFLTSCDKDIPVNVLIPKYVKANSSFMQIDGMNVHYIQEGLMSDTVPIVFIHGTSSSLHTWDSLSSLLKNYKRIIRFDLPAFGLTGPNNLNAYNYNFYNHFIDSFLFKLNVKHCILVGNSLGGGIAWNFAVAHPSKVAKLILIDASGYPKKDEKGSLGFKIAAIPVLNQLLKHVSPISLIRKSLEDAFYNNTLVSDSMVQRYHDLLLREGNRSATLELFKNPMKPDTSLIKKIQQPTLIIWGKQDQLISFQNAYLFKNAIKNSQVVVFDKVGHIPMEETPAKVAEAITAFIK